MTSQGHLPVPVGFPTKTEKSVAAGKASTGLRNPEIDWIKAIGIVTVVLIHSLPTTLTGQISDMDGWIGRMTRFAVPGFLACSGFLFAGSRSSRKISAMQQRLKRLLLPYLVFSVAAWCQTKVWAMSIPYLEDTTPFILKLLFCAALGPYYYVFLIVCLVLVTPLIARIPRRAFPVVLVAALLLQLLTETGLCPTLPTIFWHFRNPARTLGPFLVGWGASLWRDILTEHAQNRRCAWFIVLLILFFLGGAGLATLPGLSRASLALGWAQCYITLALIFVATAGRGGAPELVCWLSNASYPIYLSHLFFVTPVLAFLPHKAGAFDPTRILAAWAAGLGNSAALILIGRVVLGEKHARTWLG
mmetsp:Transcript_139520/g.347940  ORF Transcript_139520/g.347940 Transcript_139520/m.347940 type:complete len:360 (-) Transcript_139520:534-1613(-)